MNDIVAVPDWQPNSILFLRKYEIREIINGIKKPKNFFTRKRTYPKVSDIINNRNIRFKFNKYFSKFLVSNQTTLRRNKKNNDYDEFVSILPCLDLIKRKNYGLELDKFIKTKFEEFELKGPISGSIFEPRITYLFEVEYDEIREPILNFLADRIIMSNELKEFKKLFTNNKESGDFNTYLKEKTDYLLNLNLDNYIDDMNKETEKKMKKK